MENYQGAIEDPRSEEEKAQDYKHSDLGMGVKISWEEKNIEDLKKYTTRNQNWSLSCGGQAGAKAEETIVEKVISAHPPYRNRSNYPSGGMFIADVGATFKKGTTLEELDQSENQGESLLNRDIKIELPYKIKGYFQPDYKNIDEIAQAIDTWGHCILLIRANGNEWKEEPIYNGEVINFSHFICGTHYFLHNGKKSIFIEDSASLGTSIDKKGWRILSEDFLKERCYGAIYFTGTEPLALPYVFKKFLKIGSRGYEVKRLQMVLNKVLEINLAIDGKFGKNTEYAVKTFQAKFGLKVDGLVGSETNSEINYLLK